MFHVGEGLLHVLFLLADLQELLQWEFEARDSGQASEVSVGVIFQHECSVVNDCALTKTLEDERLLDLG